MRALIAIALLAPAAALAQAKPTKQPVTKIIIDGDDPIEATHRAPGGVVVDVLDPVTHQSIIRVRADFSERVLASSSELR